MVKYTLIIEYLSKGNNFSRVATLCGCSRTTVWQVLQRIDFLNISLDEINDNINNFVSLVVKTGRIKKLTPEIVRLLIDKVIVSEKVKTEDGYKRTVTICLTHVGEIELP